EACAGLRFLIATIALGTLYAHLTYRKWPKIILFMAACIVVPIIGNGFRALGIVLLAHYSDNRIAVGFDHLIYGWGFSVAIMLLLFFIGAWYRDEFPPAKAPEHVPPPASAGALLAAVVIAAVVVSAAPAYAIWRENVPLSIDASVFSAPPHYDGWEAGQASGFWTPSFSGQDAKLAYSLNRGSFTAPPVDVF